MLYDHSTIVGKYGSGALGYAMVTHSVVPQRYANDWVSPDNEEMQPTRILKLKIESASEKVHEGIPEDERKDMKREDMLNSV